MQWTQYNKFYSNLPYSTKFVCKLYEYKNRDRLSRLLLNLPALTYLHEQPIDSEVEEEIRERIAFANYEDEEKTVVRNVLRDFPDWLNLTVQNRRLCLSFFSGASISTRILTECLEILQYNMERLYHDSGWIFERNTKRQELMHPDARMLVVKSSEPDAAVVAFTHFRFIKEDEAPVIYVYELQVAKQRFGRKGIGKHLMNLLETIAEEYEMDWIMLTVFKINHAAIQFYKGLGYEIDETSPSLTCDATCYHILSKRIRLNCL